MVILCCANSVNITTALEKRYDSEDQYFNLKKYRIKHLHQDYTPQAKLSITSDQNSGRIRIVQVLMHNLFLNNVR